DCAKEIGRIHFLTGVGNEILLRAKSFCVKVLKDNLDQSIPVLKDLTHILVAAEWRLHEDIEMQISSGVATMEQYRSILASPLPPKGTLWTDARALEIRMLGQLPGLQAVLFARPDSRGVFMIEEYGGTSGGESGPLFYGPGTGIGH
ncbi:diguanylate cyclase/phosphodiesterase with PAS/PAC and GAF sensor(s), partial [mine drainage metagenome]